MLCIVDEFTRTYMVILASEAYKFNRIYLCGRNIYP